MSSKNIICNNCGKQGHQFHQCKLPITSYGIILFRPSLKGTQYLMIRRKHTLGFVDFIRGKYSIYNKNYDEYCIIQPMQKKTTAVVFICHDTVSLNKIKKHLD